MLDSHLGAGEVNEAQLIVDELRNTDPANPE